MYVVYVYIFVPGTYPTIVTINLTFSLNFFFSFSLSSSLSHRIVSQCQLTLEQTYSFFSLNLLLFFNDFINAGNYFFFLSFY